MKHLSPITRQRPTKMMKTKMTIATGKWFVRLLFLNECLYILMSASPVPVFVDAFVTIPVQLQIEHFHAFDDDSIHITQQSSASSSSGQQDGGRRRWPSTDNSRGRSLKRNQHQRISPLWSSLEDGDSSFGRTPTTTTQKAAKTAVKANAKTKNKTGNKKSKTGNKKSKRNKDFAKSSQFGLLNNRITQQGTAQDILALLAAQKGVLSSVGGGGNLSSVNLATSIHRISKHLTSSNNHQSDGDVDGNNRSKILSDPRFALLMCCVGEALVMNRSNTEAVQGTDKPFGGRELSTMAWAISKLSIAPPSSVIAVDPNTAQEKLQQKSDEVRSIIFDIAKQRTEQQNTRQRTNPLTWIPKLSELCGLIIDLIAVEATKMDRKSFRQLELSNLVYALATTDRATEESFEFIIDSMIESESNPDNTDYSKPQEWSIPLWCCAKSNLSGPGERLMTFISSLIDERSGFVEEFKPQELSNLAWATATVLSKGDGVQPDETTRQAALNICRCITKELIKRQGKGYKSQELTNSVWSLATLGFGITEEQSSRSSEHIARQYTYLPSDDLDGDRMLMERSVNLVLALVKENHKIYRNQELNNLSWVMARFGLCDDEALEIIGHELLNPRRRDLKGQDISTTLWSMATLEYSNEKLYRSLADRACQIGAQNFNAQEISNTLWALGTARVSPNCRNTFDTVLLPSSLRPSADEVRNDPVTSIFGDAAQELIRRPQEFKPQEIKDVLLAFVWTETRHPLLFQAVAEHLVGSKDRPEMCGRGLDDFNSQGIANLAYSFARHTQLGVDVLERYKTKCRIPVTGGRLAAYTTSYLDIGEGLLRKLFSEIAEYCIQNQDRMNNFSPQDVANSAWAFTIVGMKHVRFLDAANDALQNKMTQWIDGNRSTKNRLSGQELCNAIYAFAVFDYAPVNLLPLAEDYILNHLGGVITPETVSRWMNRQELAILTYIVSVFGEYPPKLVEIIYTGLVGSGDKRDASFMDRLHNDGGCMGNVVIALLYLQTIKDLESKELQYLSLPDDFPTKWSTSSSDVAGRGGMVADGMMDNGLIELHSSKVQTRISDAFSRIGFSHTEEFIFTLEDLAKDHGIGVASIPFELLSIDLADESLKIGIEVDGPGHFVTNIDEQYFSGGRNILSSVGEVVRKNGFNDYHFCWSDEDQEINGSTSLKIRLMQKLGWNIINLPFWEWYPIEGDQDAEDEYCRSVLEKSR